MALTPDLDLVEKALDRLERLEIRVLVWGLVDGALSEAEVLETLGQVLNANQDIAAADDCTIGTEVQLREKLLSFGLLTQVATSPLDAPRYRTRMAEGVRLFARLRQLFPGKHDGANWVNGPTLVADYRLLWRPRRYPDRNLLRQDARRLVAEQVNDDALLAGIDQWLDPESPELKFARFQVDATARILKGLSTRSPLGTLVSAGTGSGKTIAFYLPALAWLSAERLKAPASRGVRVIAVYPRNELLKDQLAEVYSQARKFDTPLGARGTTLSIGVLYGDTPRTATGAAKAWHKTNGACPFFRCPSCDGPVHPDGVGSAEQEARLSCHRCGTQVDSHRLRFSRHAMADSPPDILFTSVETFNRRMSDSSMRHLFGLGPRATRVPSLMLLDEVHLFSGTYGAQVAYMLRRWSHLSRRQTQFVGLSATIADGAAFFASLVGLDRSVVEEVSPSADDMRREGAEYMLALRGDPVSQAALLSTSIQALMLVSRLLDRRNQFSQRERPFAGWRSFAFTDQVDATNRLLYDLRNAEGLTPGGHPATLRAPHGGLAVLREPSPDRRRYEGGQDWRMLRSNGHALSTRHRVERTTALDAGVSKDAEIVVATAALDVGFDDPAVGAVLQHKAPRDMAQFLQRKGRAGRTRHMRPWTIMVLSDYGRDRLAYQAYEQFFDPELPPRELPLSNRYVRRMQATYALIDYLGVAMQQGEPAGSAWRDLATPTPTYFKGWPAQAVQAVKEAIAEFPLSQDLWREIRRRAMSVGGLPQTTKWDGCNYLEAHIRRRYLVSKLADLLRQPDAAESLARYVSSALSLKREDTDTLLWDSPRSLLLTVIPTALRRLATNWRAGGATAADRTAEHPLPEFIPGTLFSDLALPEVQLLGGPEKYKGEALPVLQALNELAPGKVSRRLDDALWLGPSGDELPAILAATGGTANVDVDLWYELEPELPFNRVSEEGVTLCPAWRPRALKLRPTPEKPKVGDSSNARLQWCSQLFGRQSLRPFTVPATRVGIARLVHDVVVHTHASHTSATVRRYAVGSTVKLRVKQGQTVEDYSAKWCFTREGQPCGVGFQIEVDAVCFEMVRHASPSSTLREADASVQRAARTARFQWEVQHGVALATVANNIFLRNWLGQVFQVAAVAFAEKNNCALGEAVDALRGPGAPAHLEHVLETIFQAPNAPTEDADDDNAEEPRLRARLSELLASADTRALLAELSMRILAGPIDSHWDDWLERAQRQTFAAAVMDAIQQACPQVDPDELVVDTEPSPREDGTLPGHAEVWISETNPGGSGLIEQVVEALASNTDHFFRRIETALSVSEFEQIDMQLRDFVDRVGGPLADIEWAEHTDAVRAAVSAADADSALGALRRFLAEQGHAVFHGYVSALSNRLLRPGSPVALDSLLAQVLTSWSALEARLGIEVDARVICAVFSRNTDIDDAFREAGFTVPLGQVDTWRFNMLAGVLWARGHALRTHALPVAERFSARPTVTDRLLLAPWLSREEVPIDGQTDSALEELHQRLKARGRADMRFGANAEGLDRIIAFAATVPVQLEYLNVYPRLTAVSRLQRQTTLSFELEVA